MDSHLTKWISCKDKLPKTGQKTLVFVTYKDKDGQLSSYISSGYFAEEKTGPVWEINDELFGHVLRVSHWCEMPDPPNLKEENNTLFIRVL